MNDQAFARGRSTVLALKHLMGAMKFSRIVRPLGLFILLLGMAAPEAADKSIRLRNETIVTPEANRGALQRQAAEQPASGLFIVQLEDNPPADWKATLAEAGATTIKYIPDDAWLVKLEGARPGQIRQLPFVRFVSKYISDYKSHPRLKQLAKGKPQDQVHVRMLIPEGAPVIPAAGLHKKMTVISRLAKTPVGQIIEGTVAAGRLQELMDSEAVGWIEPGPQPKLFDAISSGLVAGEISGSQTVMMDLGFDGDGVTVGVVDSGLHLGEGQPEHPDLEGRVAGYFYYGTLTDGSDEHSHGTHVTGIIAGNGAAGETDEEGYLFGLGVAPGVRVVGQRMFDGAGAYEPPPSYATLTQDALSLGAEIGSNSWGDDTQGRYDISAMEFDALVRDGDPDRAGDQPYILEFSAGNAGPGTQTIGSPAVGKNVIATGASQNNRFEFFLYADGQEAMADFSSRGPCEDGRIKPDVVAPGTWIASLKSYAAGDENAWSPISENYLYQGGTSQAGPHVSGAIAVFVQYYRETHNGATPSPALVKAALINSALDMEDEFETSPAHNHDEGWGRVDLT